MVPYNFIQLGKDPDPGSGSGGKLSDPDPEKRSGSDRIRIRNPAHEGTYCATLPAVLDNSGFSQIIKNTKSSISYNILLQKFECWIRNGLRIRIHIRKVGPEAKIYCTKLEKNKVSNKKNRLTPKRFSETSNIQLKPSIQIRYLCDF